MLRKIKKLLTNNLGLKLVSILFAVLMWLVVMNLDNPDKTQSFTIPVTVTNEDILTEMGKVYEVVNGSDVVTIYATGKRTLMDSLSATDFRATADLSQIDFQSPGDIKMIPVTITPIRYERELNIDRRTANMQVTIEDLSVEQFYISCVTLGEPSRGYAVGDVSASPNLVKVSGPQSLVSRIKRVVAAVNVSGAVGDVSDHVVPVLYDENDQEMGSSQLSLNQDKVEVYVQMLGTKEVPIRCLTTGEPADGYQFLELEYAPERIWIKGSPSVLNEISEIVIPGEAVDLTGATGNVANSIDILPYLNELGVQLRDSDENKVAVSAVVERLESKSVELPVSNIELLNLDDKYEASFGVSAVTVIVRGRSEELSKLNVSDIKASIDMEQVRPGDYNMGILVRVPSPFRQLGTATVLVHITELSGEDGGAPGEEDSGNGNDAGTENRNRG